jgi:hypothetical protein
LGGLSDLALVEEGVQVTLDVAKEVLAESLFLFFLFWADLNALCGIDRVPVTTSPSNLLSLHCLSFSWFLA